MHTLHVEPNTPPMPWEQFMATKPPFSIALDGYVNEGPKFVSKDENPRGPFRNLNHHEGVSRLETRATCAQSLYHVRLGLYKTFRNEAGEPCSELFVNDCDHDVCLSTWILRNPHMVINAINPLLNQLVHMEDLLDTMSGAYPFPPYMPSMMELCWVFEPYDLFRAKGGLDRRDADEYRMVIDEVGSRIDKFIVGKSGSVKLDTRYEVIQNHGSWVMVREIGANSRIGLFSDGIDAFVSVRERPDGRFVYSIGRSSDSVPFRVPRILDALNIYEASESDFWGGSPTIGGSPRVMGSKLTPENIAEIIEDVLTR